MGHGKEKRGPLTDEEQQKKTEVKEKWNAWFQEAKGQMVNAERTPEETAGLKTVLTKLLTVNPACYYIWNARKSLIETELASLSPEEARKVLTSELHFNTASLLKSTDNSKIYPSWYYRRWLLSQLGQEAWLAEPAVWMKQLAERDTRNFHVWDHMLTVRAHGALSEDSWREYVMNGEASNYSLWHQRAGLVRGILDSGDDVTSTILREFEEVMMANAQDPAGTSYWHYFVWLCSVVAKQETNEPFAESIETIVALAADDPTTALPRDGRRCLERGLGLVGRGELLA
ncbi:geranylgeranyl transferase type-2 subunit alpha [Carpediemonas membranifera]|uniref:Geranylgeranyl transferase type-2 subunit alpha n=1 Tax=Carpediemonas membranifera TaxID=201153 RepID=A0A8J6AWL0_9EUKA|nr:geranylgeranyl transferase type-2 subunit alpha [Carpediemonas membranifera]|eukprot:KAG9395983.1 geranylgeranyl transferase type-2 subunit alpha [Carpediemonas membranifera]